MKKFLKSLVAVALATTTLADLDLELAANGGAYSSRSSAISWTQKVGAADAATTSETWTTSGLAQNFGADIRGLYCVTEGLYLGLSLGYAYEMAFAEELKSTIGTATAVDKTVKVADQTGTAYHLIPVKAVVKYDFNDVLLADSNMYLTARGGISLAFNANTNALKTGDRYTDLKANTPIYAETGGTAAAKAHALGYLNLVFDAGLGFEYMGAQLEAYYAYKSVGATGVAGEIATNAADASVETETKAFSSYVNHSLNVSLGYRLKDLV